MKKYKGGVIIYVICIFVMVVSIGSLISRYVLLNAHRTKLQMEQTKAYYVCMGGIEMGVNAVLDPNIIDGKEVPYLLNEFKKNYKKPPLKHNYVYPNDSGSSVEINIKATNADGKAIKQEDEDIWVEIYATGIVKNNKGKVTKHKGCIRLYTLDPSRFVRIIKEPF